MPKIPTLVAHRGDATHHPENSLAAIKAAFEAGACFVEFDIQFSKDGIPFLLHDTNTERVSGIPADILTMNLDEIRNIRLKPVNGNYTEEWEAIPSLEQLVRLLENWPGRKVFMEIKEESIQNVGTHRVVKTLLEIIQPVMDQIIVISYNSLILSHVRALGVEQIGWVLTNWDTQSRVQAQKLVPNYIFCNYNKIPIEEQKLWPGPWQWVLYDVTDPTMARILATWGAQLISTFDIEKMINDCNLKDKACQTPNILTS